MSSNKDNSPFPKIEPTVVTAESLATLKSDGAFMGLAVDLMIEAGSYVCIAASLYGPGGFWTRDQAAIGGNMVRLYKIMSAMLDQTTQHRRETSFIMARLAFETIVNVRYLIKNFSSELIFKYISNSLDHEKKLRGRIEANIKARSGIVLPIEDRMFKSIDREFAASGITIDELPSKAERNWGGKTLFEKASDVEMGEIYLMMFSGPSHNVHGAWGDSYAHHLEVAGEVGQGRFQAKLEWQSPRPQLVNAISLLTLEATADFVRFIGGEEVEALLLDELHDLHERIKLAERGHEGYLAGRQWPEI